MSSAVFSYLSHYVRQAVWRWLRRKHVRPTWKQLRRRYCGGGWWPASEYRELIDLEMIGMTRYRYAARSFPHSWLDTDEGHTAAAAGLAESPVH